MNSPRLPRLSLRHLAILLVAALVAGLAAWYVHSTRQAIGELERQRDASCVAFASVGEVKLSATSSPLAQRIVTTHADAARKLGCAK